MGTMGAVLEGKLLKDRKGARAMVTVLEEL